jgi:hypothetical protein
MSNFLKRLRKLVDRDVKANRQTLQSEQNMMIEARDLTIYDGTFNHVANGTLTFNQINHDNRGSGTLPDIASFMTR